MEKTIDTIAQVLIAVVVAGMIGNSCLTGYKLGKGACEKTCCASCAHEEVRP